MTTFSSTPGSPIEVAEFVILPAPEADPTQAPTPTQSPQPTVSSGGSSSSSSSSIPAGTFVVVGTDPYGNPIREFQPYPETRTEYDLNPGWNTRAVVREPIGATMYLSYMSGAAIGAIVGLTDQPEATIGYEDIILGWMTLNGTAYILERGLVVHSVPVATTLPDPGKYSRDIDALTMRKTINKVEFFLTSDSGQGGETKVFEATMYEPVTYVSAALYLGGDIIHSEVLEYPTVLAGAVPPMVGGFYESGTASYLTGAMPAIGGAFYENDLTVFGGNLPAVAGFFGQNANSFMWSDLPALTGTFTAYSEAPLAPDFNFTFSAIPPVVGSFMVRDLTFATLGGSLPGVQGLFSDQPVSVLRGELPAVRGGFFESEFPDRFTFVSFAYMAGKMIVSPTAYLVLNSRAEVVSVFTIDEIEFMLLESGADASSTATMTEIIYQLLSSRMSAGDVAALQADGMSVWALHMDAGGSTRYENYDFNSFMTIDGQTYGVNAAGIAKIGGTTDDGAAITATVDFGSLNFGSGNRKSLPYVYVGMSSTGKTVLKVESDGSTYYYAARDATEQMKTHRFEPGRGLRSTFYGLSIISDGKAFDLHNIDFQPVELKRSL